MEKEDKDIKEEVKLVDRKFKVVKNEIEEEKSQAKLLVFSWNMLCQRYANGFP